jgi:hypothetical protein
MNRAIWTLYGRTCQERRVVEKYCQGFHKAEAFNNLRTCVTAFTVGVQYPQ